MENISIFFLFKNQFNYHPFQFKMMWVDSKPIIYWNLSHLMIKTIDYARMIWEWGDHKSNCQD